jgi:predicted phosphoribosyltransferase
MEAGQILAEKLYEMKLEQPYLLAVASGGIEVAAQIAQKLKIKIEVLVTRKLGHPLNAEVAIGAVMPDGSAIWDKQQDKGISVSQEYIDQAIDKEYAEVQRRSIVYTGASQVPEFKGKTVILVDDCIATGYTIRTAINWLKTLEPAQIIVAVPVAPLDVVDQLFAELEVDEVICPIQAEQFGAVNMYYEEFSQTTDEEVIRILKSFTS